LHTLNRSVLSDRRLAAEHTRTRQGAPMRVLQFGDGPFLRAFADWMIDMANGAGVLNANVSVVQATARGSADVLVNQQGLYTVLLRGTQESRTIAVDRLISCIDQALNPYTQWHELLALAADPSLRVVISSTSETGIAYTDEAWVKGMCPRGFPAKLTALLFERYRVFSGKPDSGLIVLPCELIEANGSNLRRIVLMHANAWNLPLGFVDWIKEHNFFCNTLVDRLVPGFPSQGVEGLYVNLGYADALMVEAEPFHLWVIEGSAHLADAFPLHKAGLSVVWTDQLKPYRTLKMRILNGALTASALAAYCAGADSVRAMMEDPVLAAFLDHLMFDEILPCVPLAEAVRSAYANSVMERFANPHIRHELLSVGLNSVSKWQLRVLPTIKDYVRAHGQAPIRLATSLAALLYFYRGSFNAAGEYRGRRGEQSYPIRDNNEVQTLFAEFWRTWTISPDTLANLVRSVLGDPRLWGEDLNLVAGLGEQVLTALAGMISDGVIETLAKLR